MFGGNAYIAVVGRLGVFIRHLEEYQVSELLQVVAIAHPVIAQRMTEAPDLRNDGGGVHAETALPFRSISQGLAGGRAPIALIPAGRFVGEGHLNQAGCKCRLQNRR